MSIENSGPSKATNVVLTTTMPATITVISTTTTQGNCRGIISTTVGKEAGSLLRCDLSALEVGSMLTVTLALTPTAPWLAVMVTAPEDIDLLNNRWGWLPITRTAEILPPTRGAVYLPLVVK